MTEKQKHSKVEIRKFVYKLRDHWRRKKENKEENKIKMEASNNFFAHENTFNTQNFNNRENEEMQNSLMLLSSIIQREPIPNLDPNFSINSLTQNHPVSLAKSSFTTSTNEYEKQNENFPQLTITEGEWQVNLIEEVRNYPCLWNTKSRTFKESNRKQQCWTKVASKLNLEG